VATINIPVRFGGHFFDRQAVERQKFNSVTKLLLAIVVLKQLEHNLARIDMLEGHV